MDDVLVLNPSIGILTLKFCVLSLFLSLGAQVEKDMAFLSQAMVGHFEPF
jgi:hypothetical protein